MLKEDEVRTYNSSQSLFAVTTGSVINIYSAISYQPYLCLRASIREAAKLSENRKLFRASTLVPEKMLNEMSEG